MTGDGPTTVTQAPSRSRVTTAYSPGFPRMLRRTALTSVASRQDKEFTEFHWTPLKIILHFEVSKCAINKWDSQDDLERNRGGHAPSSNPADECELFMRCFRGWAVPLSLSVRHPRGFVEGFGICCTPVRDIEYRQDDHAYHGFDGPLV